MKKQFYKKDIFRWISLLPLTILAIFLFQTLLLDPFYFFLSKHLNENAVAYISGHLSAIFLPLLVIVCGYYISPKFKFRSTVILVLFFLIIQTINILFNEYIRNNPAIPIFALSYLVGLYALYKKMSYIDLSKSGIYIVCLKNDKKISMYRGDLRRENHGTPMGKGNIKVGKAKNLSNRRNDYIKTFGEFNIEFKPQFNSEDIDQIERKIMAAVKKYRILGKNNRPLEWLENISCRKLTSIVRGFNPYV